MTDSAAGEFAGGPPDAAAKPARDGRPALGHEPSLESQNSLDVVIGDVDGSRSSSSPPLGASASRAISRVDSVDSLAQTPPHRPTLTRANSFESSSMPGSRPSLSRNDSSGSSVSVFRITSRERKPMSNKPFFPKKVGILSQKSFVWKSLTDNTTTPGNYMEFEIP